MTIPPLLSAKRRINRISPLQLGKILAILCGAMALLALPFFLIGVPVTSHLPVAQRGIFAFIGVGMALALPVYFACIGFSLAATTLYMVGAALYNLIAQGIGGIEADME